MDKRGTKYCWLNHFYVCSSSHLLASSSLWLDSVRLSHAPLLPACMGGLWVDFIAFVLTVDQKSQTHQCLTSHAQAANSLLCLSILESILHANSCPGTADLCSKLIGIWGIKNVWSKWLASEASIVTNIPRLQLAETSCDVGLLYVQPCCRRAPTVLATISQLTQSTTYTDTFTQGLVVSCSASVCIVHVCILPHMLGEWFELSNFVLIKEENGARRLVQYFCHLNAEREEAAFSSSIL